MPNPPARGRKNKGKTPGLPIENSHSISRTRSVRETQQDNFSTPASTSEGHAQQAINDAQQGLHSLLNPPREDDQPHIISLSGAIRHQRRGRVAGPVVHSNGDSRLSSSDRRQIAGNHQPHATDNQLTVVRPSHTQDLSPAVRRPALPAQRPAPIIQQRDLIIDYAKTGVESVREHSRMLVYPVDEESVTGADAQAAQLMRRSAAQWVTRYATHLVVLLVIGVLAAVGGLRTLTVANDYPTSLMAVGPFTGTDYTEEEDSQVQAGKPEIDSQDFQLTLPRTELGNAGSGTLMLPSTNTEQQAGATNPNPSQQSQPASTAAKALNVNRYTVVEGDTIETVAATFNVMPETVMGSNGIFDPDETLTPGRLLRIPPVDGMYYVAANGDTLAQIANKFQVDPQAIRQYGANKIEADGSVQVDTPLIVPGGMMPERETTITYTVQPGDTLKQIAARFRIDVPTMINSNDIPDPDNLQPGSELRVLPVQGMEYKIKKGDTIIDIADRYGTTPQMILDYAPNRLDVSSILQESQVIMLPGGAPAQVIAAGRVQPSARGVERPPERQPEKPQPQPEPKSKPAAPKPSDNAPKAATGRMVWPVNGVITQYFTRRHNGLDIATRAGTPIHAADAGEVIWAGWRTDGLGYCVMINHHNGLTTVYGHMIRQPPVYVGKYVKRGQLIGYIGSTGRSTGPHVHFMIKVGGGSSHTYRNPLSYLGK